LKKFYLLFVVVFCLLGGSVYSQQDYSKAEIQTQQISDNIYILTLSNKISYGGKQVDWFVNFCVFKGENGLLLVDNGFEETADKLKEAIKKISGKEVKYVINTHYHPDHTGANKIFASKSEIISHENTRKLMVSKIDSEDINFNGLPNITFVDSLNIRFNDERIKLFHLKCCHSEGDIGVFFTKSKVLCLGDYIVGGGFPYLNPLTNGDIVEYIDYIQGLIKKLPEDVKIISGHGKVISFDEFKEYHKVLIKTVEIIENCIREGKSVEEIKKDNPLKEWKNWSTGILSIDGWAEILYLSLTDNKKEK